jgi:hypothetical protein
MVVKRTIYCDQYTPKLSQLFVAIVKVRIRFSRHTFYTRKFAQKLSTPTSADQMK